MSRTYSYSKSNPQFTPTQPGSTHPANVMPPADFRAKATGVGNTCAASLTTGRVRSQMVVDCASRLTAPAAQSEVMGYPPKTPEYPGLCATPYRGKGIGY
jgi:hypothetical protein